MELYAESQSSASTVSLATVSPSTTPLTSPDISDDGIEFEQLPPLSENGNRNDHLVDSGRRLSDDAPGNPPKFILVIGGLGYIGSHTVLELLRGGYNVIVVDNLSNSFESVLNDIRTLAAIHSKESGKNTPLLKFHRLDYRSRSMRLLLESYSDLVMTIDASGKQKMSYRSRIAGVIHFAAHKSVMESIKHPLQYYRNNVCGLVSLLEHLDHYGIHNFIFSSSATVYGTKADDGLPLREEEVVHVPEEIVDEAGNTSILRPSTVDLSCPYARTKFFAEAILTDVAVSNPAWRIVALRYFNPVGCDPSGILGESPRGEATNLYPMLTRVLTGVRTSLDVFGSDWATRDGTAVRDFIHVLDVARGHISALKWNVENETGGGFRTFNLGSGTGTTVLEAVQSLEAAAGRKIPLRWTGRRPGDVGICIASTERARKELEWSPKESVAKCATDVWNFIQKAAARDVASKSG